MAVVLTSTTQEKRPATLEDLYRVDGKAELVNGEIIEYMATGGLPGYASDEIYASLRQYGRATRRGIAVADNKGFVVALPNRESFSPDAAFWTGAPPTMRFYQGAPVFAVEVRSENDYGAVAETEMTAKRADYFAAGTEVVWDVDLRSETATVRKFTKAGGGDMPSQVFGRADTADAEPALPEWRFVVADLFPLAEETGVAPSS